MGDRYGHVCNVCKNVPLFLTGYTSLSNISCVETVAHMIEPANQSLPVLLLYHLPQLLLGNQIRKMHIGCAYVYSSPSQHIAQNKIYARLMACCATKPPPPSNPFTNR